MNQPTKFTVYAITEKSEFKRRKNVTTDSYFKLMDIMDELAKVKAAERLIVFPATIDPNQNPVYGAMHRIVQKSVKHYQNDFYHCDTAVMHEMNEEVLWLVRDHGTGIFNAKEHTGEAEKEGTIINFKHYMRESQGRTDKYKLYLIKGTDLKKISFDDGLAMLDRSKVKEPTPV